MGRWYFCVFSEKDVVELLQISSLNRIVSGVILRSVLCDTGM